MNDEPFLLYKFRRIDKWLVESLVNQSLYFARPDTLNDPFDCRINLKRVLGRAESFATGDRKRFFASLLDNPDFFNTWESTFETIGVFCCSRTIDEILLWSHYANEHRGVCLEYQFRPSSFLREDFLLTAAGNVEYLTEPLADWLTNAPIDNHNFVTELVHKYLKTKSPAWKYEQEARIIRREHGTVNFSVNEPFLKEVCFGLRTTRADIDLITSLARTYTRCTRFSQMVPNETEFGFTRELLYL